MSLRNYIVHLRENDELIKEAYQNRISDQKPRVTIKSMLSEPFLEHCDELELTNRDIAHILNCSAGTVGGYVSTYSKFKFDDLLYEKADYTEEIIKYKAEPINYPVLRDESLFLLVSDIQAGALVTADGYDSNPERTVNTYFELLYDRVIDAIVDRQIAPKDFNIILLGDLVDGWKKFANQQTVPVRKQKDILVKNILKFIKDISFALKPDSINIYGVWGNHGEIDKNYPSSDNWDTVVMEEIALHIGYLRDLDNAHFGIVNSFISDKEIQKHKIGNFTYFISHGHQQRGFSVENWKKSMNKFHVSQGGFDAALMGHWHTFNWISNNGMHILINGCMYRSDFVQNKLAGKEDICQVLFAQNEYEAVAWVEKLNIDQGIHIKE